MIRDIHMDMEMSYSLSLDLILLIESVVVNDSLFSSVLEMIKSQLWMGMFQVRDSHESWIIYSNL